jgi:hypothetical protein
LRGIKHMVMAEKKIKEEKKTVSIV